MIFHMGIKMDIEAPALILAGMGQGLMSQEKYLKKIWI